MISTFSFQPVLTGTNVSIRAIDINDFESLYEYASDKKLWEGHPAKDRYKKSVFEKWFKDALESGSTVVFLDNVTANVIGSSRFYVNDESPADISIGYTFLARSYWGGKTNFELKKLMLDYAFTYFNSVWFHIAPSNIRSQKAVEKIGGIFAYKRLASISGTPDNWLFYKISKVDWKLQSAC